MRRALLFSALAVAGVLAAAEPAPDEPAAPMKVPDAPAWGASWEPTPRPTAPARTDVPWLQPLIDAAPEGGLLVVPPGTYSGPVVLTKPLVIDGQGKVIIDGGGKATVFVLEASHVTLRGLTLQGSGNSHNSDDACLNVRGSDNVIEHNEVRDCLFGIDLKQANRNQVRANHIRSKDVPLGQRGDALRLWYSMDNVVEDNVVTQSRDIVVWYSNGNHLKHNTATGGRYSLHFMYAQHNVAEGNVFKDNSVGIYVMYTDGVEIRNNLISHSVGATGLGIGFTEASDSVVEGNEVVYCAIGISADKSPYQPDSTITIRNNRIAYNGVGIAFIGDKEGTTVEGNTFEGNVDQVSQSGGGNAQRTVWRGNFWDDYQGFDRDGDGQGDTPHEVYVFADRVWMELPHARFFKNAPLLEALDFLERLAPFTTPELLLRDETPRFNRPTEARHD